MITKADIPNFTFDKYRKKGTTPISRELLAPGTVVATLEGNFTCAAHSYLATDIDGNVYPIAQGVFAGSYELVPGGQTAAETELQLWQNFAAYCRSCALSGESDPQTFEEYVSHLSTVGLEALGRSLQEEPEDWPTTPEQP